MKRILLAATILVALTSAAFADGKNSNAKLLGDLKASLKGLNESAWNTTESYKKASFSFNGKVTNAYLDVETNNLIGFGITISTDALPQNSMENIAKKFKGWDVINPIMFLDASGKIAYYVQVHKGKNNLALKISEKGKPFIYSRMS